MNVHECSISFLSHEKNVSFGILSCIVLHNSQKKKSNIIEPFFNLLHVFFNINNANA